MTATRAVLAAPGALFAALKPPLGDSLAMVEADRCLECGGPATPGPGGGAVRRRGGRPPAPPAPCVAACPAGIDVPGFIHAIVLGDAIAGAEMIFAENLLGGSCARGCPAEERCEGACVL